MSDGVPDRFLRRVEQDFRYGPPARRPRTRPEALAPGERSGLAPRRRRVAWALAAALPPVTASALLPLRADHAQVTALVLVVPVVVVAALGAKGPAVLAALTAGAAYDVLHTEPYGRFVIDDPDDIVTAVAMVVVGLVVGVLCSQVVQLRARDAGRRSELRHLLQFAGDAADEADAERLVAEARRHLVEVLSLRACEWLPGYHGTAGPVLLPDGAIMGHALDLDPDRSILPEGLEVPAKVGRHELGRFVLTPGRQVVVSAEERLTAATIVLLFATARSRL